MRKEELLDFTKIKDKIYICLMNYDRNVDILKEAPHRKYLDLAITYKVWFESDNHGILNADVNYTLAKCWNVTEENLYNLAINNTPRLFKFETHNIYDLLDEHEIEIVEITQGEISEVRSDRKDMLVLNNNFNNFGSHILLYPDYIREVLRKNNVERAYILPSSIHDIILMLEEPGKESANAIALLNMVREVNENVVEDSDILADSVYEISLTDDISIAASYRIWKGRWDY